MHKRTTEAAYALQKATAPYTAHFDGKKAILKAENGLFGDIFADI